MPPSSAKGIFAHNTIIRATIFDFPPKGFQINKITLLIFQFQILSQIKFINITIILKKYYNNSYNNNVIHIYINLNIILL